jgi:hypothetical protein
MKKIFNKACLGIIFLMLTPSFVKADSNDFYEKDICLDIHHQWLTEAYTLTKNCVGFSAPVSGRAYGYFSIGMYDSTVEILPELQSLTGQLDGYSRQEWLYADDINWKLVANSADFEMLNYLYRNMPPSNLVRIENVYDSIRKSVDNKTSCWVKKQSIAYGKRIAMEIIEWSKHDGADSAFDDNYPESFEAPQCISCWTKTTPGYLPSLLPYWGENKQFLTESHLVAKDCAVFEFSSDSSSFMYKEAMGVLDNSNDLDPKYELIAEYWDDGAGYSGTPSGHFFTMAMQLVIKEDRPLDQALELYVKLGVAVNEAFISAFSLKYTYNFIRPITYIQRYIDPQFNTRIASPPFPEFPSGHSFQSGAATEVMKSIFMDTIQIIDSTNVGRSDIDGSPRIYSSLTEVSEEISISRLYGGIHFKESLDVSLKYGRMIGQYVSTKLKCRK